MTAPIGFLAATALLAAGCFPAPPRPTLADEGALISYVEWIGGAYHTVVRHAVAGAEPLFVEVPAGEEDRRTEDVIVLSMSAGWLVAGFSDNSAECSRGCLLTAPVTGGDPAALTEVEEPGESFGVPVPAYTLGGASIDDTGETLLFVSEDNTELNLARRSGADTSKWTVHGGLLAAAAGCEEMKTFRFPRMSPDGTRIAFECHTDPDIYAFDNGGARICELDISATTLDAFDPSAATCGVLFPSAGAEQTQLHPAYGANGTLYFTIDDAENERAIFRRPAGETYKEQVAVSGGGALASPCALPDGRLVAMRLADEYPQCGEDPCSKVDLMRIDTGGAAPEEVIATGIYVPGGGQMLGCGAPLSDRH